MAKFLTWPPRYVWATVYTSVVASLFGFDTGMIGPITTMSQFENTFGALSSTVQGLVVSAILLPAAAASIFAGHLADAVGRPRAMAIGTLIFGTGAALESASVHIAMLVVGRVITGIGEGLFLSSVVVYICEIAPPKHRGPLASVPQLLITVGILVGYFLCYGTAALSTSLSWRLPFAIQSFLSFSCCISCLTLLPQSPRWLSFVGRPGEALQAWETLGVSATERERTAALLDPTSLQATPAETPTGNSKKASVMLKVFAKDVRSRTLLGVFLMGMMQLSGIDGVLYYAPLLFQEAGLSGERSSFLASGISAVVICGSTIPAFYLADKWGRRTSTIYGGLGLVLTMVILGSLYASGSVHGSSAGSWVVIITIYIYTLIFSTTWAIGFRVYASEIQPPETRAAAASLAQTSNWVVNFAVALTTPIFLSASSYGVYFLFAGCTFLTVVVCWLFMPETRGRSLEAINESFHTDIPILKMKRGLGMLRSHKAESSGSREKSIRSVRGTGS